MRPEQFRNQILAADLACIPVALAIEQALCAGIRCHHASLGAFNFVVYAACTVLAWVLLFENMALDGFRGGWRLPALTSRLVLAVALLMLLLVAVENAGSRYVGRVSVAIFAVCLFNGFLIIRWLALRHIYRRHQSGNLRSVVILGAGRLAVELAEKLNQHPELLCRVVGFLSPGTDTAIAQSRTNASPASTISSVEVVSLLQRRNVDELVLAHPPASREILDLVETCRKHAIAVSVVPQPYELYLSRPRLLDLGGLPLLKIVDTSAVACAPCKRIVDLALGSVLAVFALPVVLACAAILRLSSGRGFRWETRVGQHGREFSMLRLNVDRDPSASVSFARLLWYFSLSEVPQLWNVLGGEMALVGPRPEGPERARNYSAWERERLAVKPGMTGLAQVHGLRERHSSEDKTRLDLQYMLHTSTLRDLSLLLETGWTLTLRLIQLLPRAFRLPFSRRVSERRWPPIPASDSFSEILPHAHRTQPGSD